MRPREDDTGRDKGWDKPCWLDTCVSFRPRLRHLGWLQQPTSFLPSPAPHPPNKDAPPASRSSSHAWPEQVSLGPVGLAQAQ